MFSWSKKENPPAETKAPSASPGDPIIAALLLDRTEFDLAATQTAIASGTIAGISSGKLQIDKGILSFTLPDEMVFVAPMGAPYPWKDLEGPCHTSWMWPPQTPAMTMKDHKSFVLVTATNGQGDPISRRVVFTHLMGRLANLPGVIGINWPEATLVHYPPVFVKMAAIASKKTPALMLWVDFRIIRQENGRFTCFTTGLSRLGLMEMEIANMEMQPGELREWAMNIVMYMFKLGGPIPNGNTIGATKDTQLRVTHGPSSFGAKGTVMRFGAA